MVTVGFFFVYLVKTIIFVAGILLLTINREHERRKVLE